MNLGRFSFNFLVFCVCVLDSFLLRTCFLTFLKDSRASKNSKRTPRVNIFLHVSTSLNCLSTHPFFDSFF
jgi:hypothetical protein